MNTQSAELLAAFFAASKLKTRYENLKKSTGHKIQGRIEEQITSGTEKIKSVNVASLNMQRDGLYRILFGGASALAYIEEPTRSMATFLYSVGNKKSGSLKLKKKEDLLEVLGIKCSSKTPSAIVNDAIIDEIGKNFPELKKCNLTAKASHSIVASKKQSAPTIEEAIDEVHHWMLLKKIERIQENIDLEIESPVVLFAEYNKRMKLADDLKNFLSGCIYETFADGIIPSNDFVSVETSSRIGYDRDLLKNITGEKVHKYSSIVEMEEKTKKGVEVRWCGNLDEVSTGMLPQTLIEQLKNSQAPRGEKEAKVKISERVFFQRQTDTGAPSRSLSI